ncbi:hypothetical protein, partial [Agromyces seonyuensis]
MTSYTPAAGRIVRPAPTRPRPERLVAAPMLPGAQAVLVRTAAPIATAAAAAGITAIGARAALEADGLV